MKRIIKNNKTIDSKIKELLLFISEYEPYNKNKFKNLHKDDRDLLFKFSNSMIGKEFGSHAANDIFNKKKKKMDFYTVEWVELIKQRREHLNSYFKLD